MKPQNSNIPRSILTINGGSSSIKFALYQAGEPLKRELYGKVDRIGLSGTNLTFKEPARNQEESIKLEASDHKSAATFLLDWLQKQNALESVRAVGHRVVHGMQHTALEVVGVTGYVQQLNVRSTILMTFDGNLVQIPNATIYKNNLRNFTTNSNRCEDFVVGIGYGDSINEAPEIARKVLVDHPAILNDPEPWVLADSLGQATINLRVYFWLNGREHSWLKVRPSVIRLVKPAFQEHGISMPDEAREIIFPEGVPVTMLDGKPLDARDARPRQKLPADSPHGEPDAVSTKAEAGFSSEAVVIEEQARHAQPLKHGENLLPVPPGSLASEKQAKAKAMTEKA